MSALKVIFVPKIQAVCIKCNNKSKIFFFPTLMPLFEKIRRALPYFISVNHFCCDSGWYARSKFFAFNFWHYEKICREISRHADDVSYNEVSPTLYFRLPKFERS